MKKILCALLLLMYAGAYSQKDDFKKPDYKEIEKTAIDKKSPLCFETLFERFNRADSTMTVAEKQHLYFGYSFTKAYAPYGSNSPAEKELKEFINKKEEPGQKEMEQIIELCGKVLKDDPFSIRTREYLLYFLKQLGRADETAKEDIKLNIILDGILSTGNGTTKEKCIYVISVANEYEIISVLNFDFGGKQSFVENRYDYLELAKNQYKIEGLYFDISRSFDSLKK